MWAMPMLAFVFFAPALMYYSWRELLYKPALCLIARGRPWQIFACCRLVPVPMLMLKFFYYSHLPGLNFVARYQETPSRNFINPTWTEHNRSNLVLMWQSHDLLGYFLVGFWIVCCLCPCLMCELCCFACCARFRSKFSLRDGYVPERDELAEAVAKWDGSGPSTMKWRYRSDDSFLEKDVEPLVGFKFLKFRLTADVNSFVWRSTATMAFVPEGVWFASMFLVLDVLLDLNTLFSLLIAAKFHFAFCMVVMFATMTGLEVRDGKFWGFWSEINRSVRRGAMTPELIDTFDVEKGFEGFFGALFTIYTLVFVVRSKWQLLTQVCSILLSLYGLATYLHQVIDLEKDESLETDGVDQSDPLLSSGESSSGETSSEPLVGQ